MVLERKRGRERRMVNANSVNWAASSSRGRRMKAVKFCNLETLPLHRAQKKKKTRFARVIN